MDNDDNDNVQYLNEVAWRMGYQQRLKSGDFVEEVFQCLDCGVGDTCLINVKYTHLDRCMECGSENLSRSIVRF